MDTESDVIAEKSPNVGFNLNTSNCPETPMRLGSGHKRLLSDLPAQLTLNRDAFLGRIMPSWQNNYQYHEEELK